MDQEKVKRLIYGKISHLPTLPEMIQKVVSMVQDEKTSARDLSNLISYDQAISSRLLRIANSAYYGLSRGVSTTQHAIVVLGFEEVKSLSLSITVFDAMKGTSDGSSLIRDEFWKHSAGCSLAAKIICKKLVNLNADTAFTASLLHDIGKLVLDSFFSGEYNMVLEKAQRDGLNLVDIEKELLGFTHADVGMWLCNRWKLPPSLASSIGYHHQVGKVDQEYISMTSIVHLADIICKKANIGSSGNETIPPLQDVAREKLRVEGDQIDCMIIELQNEEEKVNAFMSSIK